MPAGKKYLRCACPACANVLTYPDYSAGGTSVCTKCNKPVRLPAPPAAPPPAAPKPAGAQRSEQPLRRGFPRFLLWSVNLAVLVAALIIVQQRRMAGQPDAAIETTAVPTIPPATPGLSIDLVTTNNAAPAHLPETPTATNIVTITNVVTVTNAPAPPTNLAANPNVPPVPNPSSTNGLPVLSLAIERPRGNKGSRLTYVTGVLQNQSDQKRFGVRIDLNLLDAARNVVGMATDYATVIEPRNTWRFRALVLDSRAVGASVAAIKEDQ